MIVSSKEEVYQAIIPDEKVVIFNYAGVLSCDILYWQFRFEGTFFMNEQSTLQYDDPASIIYTIQ